MIDRKISDKVLTIGPSPKMKGGIAQVLSTYFSEVFEHPKFIAETIEGSKLSRICCSVSAVFKLVATLCTDKKIKIVHLHTASGISFRRSSLYAYIARLFGKNTILHIHGANFKEYLKNNEVSVRKQLSKASCVVALSNTWADFFTHEVNIPNTRVVPNIVSKPQIDLKTRDNDIVHCLFLGQLGQRKGIYDLLDAIKLAEDVLCDKFMLHIGGNGEIQNVQNRIKTLGIERLVTLHGWIGGNAKIELLNKCAIYILPSYAEGLPISILEAMAYKMAIISTPVGGIPEVVDSTNGIVVNTGDTKALADAICLLVGNRDILVSMGEVSSEKSKPHLASSISNNLSDLYSAILTQNI